MKNSPKQKLQLSTALCSRNLDFQIIVAPPDCKEIICNSDFQSINQGIFLILMSLNLMFLNLIMLAIILY